MKKIAYILYLLFIEAPIVLIGLAHYLGITAIVVNFERAHIYELARQSNDAISRGVLPE